MSKKHMALIFPLLALGLATLACNRDTLDQQAIADQVEVAQRVNEALAATEAAASAGAQADAAVEEVTVAEEAQPPATYTPTPTATQVQPPTLVPPVETGCTDRVEFVTDVTVEDGADFEPGDHFTKTWRLRNAGSCTWTSSYDLVFSHGDAMSGPAAMALPAVVEPGHTLDLSVNLIAPDAEGGYQGYWLLRNGDGALFGLGANADVAFWVEIEVIEPDSGITLLIPGQVFLLFASDGKGQNLLDGWCFDLDEGAISSCGNPAADFQYDATLSMQGFPPTMELTTVVDPGHNALFGSKRTEVPSGADCQASVLTAADREISSGIYCYRTSEGKYGYIRVLSRDLTSMSFDWATYNFP